MRVGLGQFNVLTDEKLAFIKQVGADDFLMNTPQLPGDAQWEYEDLAELVCRAEAAELRLMCLENVPVHFYAEIMLGQDGRDKQLGHMATTVRNMGQFRLAGSGAAEPARRRRGDALHHGGPRRRPPLPRSPVY